MKPLKTLLETWAWGGILNAMQNLDKPEDSNHIIFQIHSYPNWQSKNNAKNEIDNLISNIKAKLIDRAPVIIGEYATFTTGAAHKESSKRSLYPKRQKVCS